MENGVFLGDSGLNFDSSSESINSEDKEDLFLEQHGIGHKKSNFDKTNEKVVEKKEKVSLQEQLEYFDSFQIQIKNKDLNQIQISHRESVQSKQSEVIDDFIRHHTKDQNSGLEEL